MEGYRASQKKIMDFGNSDTRGCKYPIERDDFFTQHGHVCLVIFPVPPSFLTVWPYVTVTPIPTAPAIDWFCANKRQENPRENVSGYEWLARLA